MIDNFATYFRPKTFDDVVGQSVAKSVLKKIAHADGIVARSIFLKGSFGSGKSTLARIFSRALNCSEFKSKDDVCNECNGCKEAMTQNTPLYMELDSSLAGNVDFIRSLQSRLTYIPNGRRLVVFDESHSASKAALNALLKLIEDGVPNTIFMFCSTEDMMPTIKSRSICVDITPIPYDLIIQRLSKVVEQLGITVPANHLEAVAFKSHGHMRDALSILQLYTMVGDVALKTSYSSIVKFFKLAVSKRKTDALETLKDIMTYSIVDVRESLFLFIHNMFCAEPNTPLYPFVSSGWVSKIYSYIFSPVSQNALKEEAGIELVFLSFLEKACK